MADIDDIVYPHPGLVGRDEAIDLLRQIRLSRRTSAITKRRASNERIVKQKKDGKLNSSTAAEILKILEGK